MAKRTNIAPLEAIRLLIKPIVITLQPLIHQINALPKDPDLEYYFISAEHMELFSVYHRPGQPYKNLKLINFDRPAILLTFFTKHKYKVDQSVKPERAQEILEDYRNELLGRFFFNQMNSTQQKELKHIDTLLRSVRHAPDQFKFCISNYHHYYQYWYCSFRYFEDETQTKTSTDNEHMLKHTQRTNEQSAEQLVNERMNIIFVNNEYITRPVVYDNKLVDKELATYPDRISFGKAALYIKPIN